MSNENQTLTKIGESIVQKFANEEIMTKSELDGKLDAVMEKYTRHIDTKFAIIDDKFALMDNKIDALRADVDKRFEQVDKRFEQV